MLFIIENISVCVRVGSKMSNLLKRLLRATFMFCNNHKQFIYNYSIFHHLAKIGNM